MLIYLSSHSCWQGGGVHIEYLNNIVKSLAVQLSAVCREGLDEKLCDGLVDSLHCHDGQHFWIFLTALLPAASFSSGIIGYGVIFVQLDMSILLVDRSNLFLTLT